MSVRPQISRWWQTGKYTFLLALSFLLLWGCNETSDDAGEPPTLQVAVAANAIYVADSLAVAFQEETGVVLKLSPGASGALYAQIDNGAPFDVFLTSDVEYAEKLKANGKVNGSVETYAYSQLVLWSTTGVNLDSGLHCLLNEDVATIAIGNPRLAPHGVAAQSAMQWAGIWEDQKLQSKIREGESIGEVNQLIFTGGVDIGFTSLSAVKEGRAKNVGAWVVLPPESYAPIQQAMVITEKGTQQHHDAARQFLDFLQGEKGRSILAFYGYDLP